MNMEWRGAMDQNLSVPLARDKKKTLLRFSDIADIQARLFKGGPTAGGERLMIALVQGTRAVYVRAREVMRTETGAKAPVVADSRFGLVFLSLAVSLVLHAGLAMGLLNEKRSEPPKREQLLVVEFIGMVGNRQLEQKQRGNDSAQKAPALPPQEMAKKTAKKATAPTRKAPSPVKAKALPEKTETRPEPKLEPEQQPEQQATNAAPAAGEQALPKGADAQQELQTLKPRELEASLIRKYLAGLKQAIQNHLEYPQEARDSGYVGAPVIRFTITDSGDILPGSLAVQKSSGSALLDERALLAARGAAPMAKPPRQMAVTITVAFTQDG